MDESSDVLRDDKKEHPFVFFITIVSARGLPKTTGGVTSNPFIRVKYHEQRYRTSTVPKSLQPIWNESFIFPYQPHLKAILSVYDNVSFGRDTVIGDIEVSPPQPYQPLAKWFSVKARNRSVLDIGRTVVEQKENESIGQIFVAMALLDPLELTIIGQQGFDITEDRNDRSTDEWPSIQGSSSPSPLFGSTIHSYNPMVAGVDQYAQTPKRRASAVTRTLSTPITFTEPQQVTPPPQQEQNLNIARRKKVDRRKSFRHQSIDSTVGALKIFQELKAIRLRIILKYFNRWRLVSYFLEEYKISEEGAKKLLMEAKFKSRAAAHRIKALETQLANIHSEKYQKEMITLRAQKEINNELSQAKSRAENAEALVEQLEKELMGTKTLEPSVPTDSINRTPSVSDIVSAKESRLTSKTPILSTGTMSPNMKQPSTTLSPNVHPNNAPTHAIEAPNGGMTRSSVSSVNKYHSLAIYLSLATKFLFMKLLHHSFRKWVTHTRKSVSSPPPSNNRSETPPIPPAMTPTNSDQGKDSKNTEDLLKLTQELADINKRYNDLKKQSATYKDQVKAHWSKTEAYIKKVKDMAAEERKKRNELKSEIEKLSSENLELKVQLESKQVDERKRYSLNLKDKIVNDGQDFQSPDSPTSRPISIRLNSTRESSTNFPNPEVLEAESRPTSLSVRSSFDLRPSTRVVQVSSNVSEVVEEITSPTNVNPTDLQSPTPAEQSPYLLNKELPTAVNSQLPTPAEHLPTPVDSQQESTADSQLPTSADLQLPIYDQQRNYGLENSYLQPEETGSTSLPTSYPEGYENGSNFKQSMEAENWTQLAQYDQAYTQSYDADYYHQWEALYAEAQQQLAAEMSAKEESLRNCEYLREQLQVLQIQAKKERELYEQIIQLMSPNQVAERSVTPPPVTSPDAPRLRGRRQSLPNLNLQPKNRRASVTKTEESNRSIGFSSKLFRVVSQSDDNDSNDEEEILSIPVLPDLDISSAIDEYSSNEVVPASVVIQNPAIEEAMTAKIRSTSSSSPYPAKPIAPPPKSLSTSLQTHQRTSEDEQLDSIWRMLNESSDSSSIDGSTNVRVAIRMRPLNSRELDLQSHKCVQMIGGTEVVVTDPEAMQEHRFNFDFCFDTTLPDSDPSAGSQQITFEKIGVEVLANAWKGYNASLFAYGQTGSGKSYSMMGSETSPGIIPRICRALFYLIRRYNMENGMTADDILPEDRPFTVEASYLEIYNEKIRDLLDPSRQNLRVREHPTTGVFVENLSTCAVESYKDVEDLLEMGLEQRTTASTNMNNESSRSHSVFTITIRFQSTLANGKRAVRLCKLCLVDLAGSERANATGATGARLKEGANINKSLSTLGRCISALAKVSSEKMKSGNSTRADKVPIPFRESVLTWLLRESLCGNAKTTMLATISPAGINYGESLSTLRYAFSAKQIFTQAVVNEDPTTKIITDLRNEVLRLREQLLLQGSVGEKKTGLSPEVTQKLLQAEETLRNYAKQWETKQQSMKMVKSKLLKKKFAAFGTGDLHDEELGRTPYLISLSSDPMLNLAVKIYLPAGNTLRIGKAIDSTQSTELQPDLQIDGLGIEPGHCILHHQIHGDVLLTSSAPGFTYINGCQLSNPEIQLNGSDRIVLGVCSHVFAFIDPNHSNKSLPTYEQALREVILGRGETEQEKKERLAGLIWNIWRGPRHRRIFEERLVDVLKGVREATTLAHQICPYSGIYFETSLSSIINITALYSLKIKDLFEYSNIMIRVRCCSYFSLSDSMINHEVDIHNLPYYERLALCSLASYNGNLTQQNLLLPKRRHSSFTTQLQAWKSQDFLFVFESPLINFMEGVEVLRQLCDSTRHFRDVINYHRINLQEIQYNSNNFHHDTDDILCSINIISSLLQQFKGEEDYSNFQNFITSCDQSSSSPTSTIMIDSFLYYLNEIISIFDLNTSITSSLLQYFIKSSSPSSPSSSSSSSSVSMAILNTLDACLHEAIISCFESIDLLVPNFDLPFESNSSPLQENPIPQSHYLPDEVSLLLQQLASLREENQTSTLVSYSADSMGSTSTQEYQGSSSHETTAYSYNTSTEAASDWVTYYDESSGRYYLYSESLGESKWID